MKKRYILYILIVLPFMVIAQDNVKVDNKKLKEKGGAADNPEIRKSKKEMSKQMDKYGKKKYKKEVGHKKKENNEQKEEKKEEKKAL